MGAAWTGNILEGIDPGNGGTKRLDRVSLHRPKSKAMYAQDVYIFAQRSWQAEPGHLERRDTDLIGAAVIVDAKFGHAAAQAKERSRQHARTRLNVDQAES